MVKVPCDPAQVIVNHASFRVQLASGHPGGGAAGDTAPLSRIPVTAGAGPAGARRRPVVWSGRSSPGDAGASSLLQAVRGATAGAGPDAATQVLPRVGDEWETTVDGSPPTVVAPRSPGPARRGADAPTQPMHRIPRPGRSPDLGGYAIGPDGPDPTGDGGGPEPGDGSRAPSAGTPRPRPRTADGRQAFYPDRRMSLGVVLLPLRLLLGFLAFSAGMGKLTDPVYFDGGVRGSMVVWLRSLEPWTVAEPLHAWALAHPVGAGLTVAFTQIIVGVLTLCGLWQRLAAALGAALSLALLVTVSWQGGPAYDAPDLILLAAWSPLIIAGAPVYSLDARLAGEAWRTLGPRAPLAELRLRVVRRGATLAAVLLGLALLVGSVLGSAVRSSQVPTLPEPGERPRNHLPGEPLPDSPDGRSSAGPGENADGGAAPQEEEESSEEPSAEESGSPESSPTPEATGGSTAPVPESEVTVPAPQQPAEQPVSEPSQPATGASGGATGGGQSEAETPAGSGSPTEDGGDSSSLGSIGGLLD